MGGASAACPDRPRSRQRTHSRFTVPAAARSPLSGPPHPTGTPPPARPPLCAGRFLYPPGSRAKRVRRDRSAAGAAIGPLSALSPPRAVGRWLHSPAPAPAATGPSEAVVDRAREDLSNGRGVATSSTPCERSNAASCTAWPLGVRGGFMRQQGGGGDDGGGARGGGSGLTIRCGFEGAGRRKGGARRRTRHRAAEFAIFHRQGGGAAVPVGW